MSKANEGLPEAAMPRVFHHEGKRLFVIAGELRVADVDLGVELELSRDRNVRTDLIDPYRENLLMLGSVLRIDPKARQLVCFDPDGVSQSLASPAIVEQVFDLLKTEGLIDPSKRGVKPHINFLNTEQAKFVIVTSAKPKGRQLLVDLLKMEKAWKADTLQPAPAIHPKTVEARLLERIVAEEARPEDPRVAAARPLTLEEWREAEASMIRDSASLSNGALRGKTVDGDDVVLTTAVRKSLQLFVDAAYGEASQRRAGPGKMQ